MNGAKIRTFEIVSLIDLPIYLLYTQDLFRSGIDNEEIVFFEAEWSLADYYVSKVYTEDRDLSEAIFELRRTIHSPWVGTDLLLAVGIESSVWDTCSVTFAKAV